MTDNQNVAGSQAGQQGGTGSQAGQGAGSQQGSGDSTTQQSQPVRLDGMQDGESLEDFARRISGELSTTRKQAARYRTRLQGAGITEGEGDGTGSQAGQGQGQGQNQQGGDDRITRLENELRAEREARRADKVSSQLISALATAGAINPSRAARMIAASELDIANDGTVENLEDVINTLKGDVPAIFTDVRGNGDGGAGNRTPAGGDDFNAMIRRRAGLPG